MGNKKTTQITFRMQVVVQTVASLEGEYTVDEDGKVLETRVNVTGQEPKTQYACTYNGPSIETRHLEMMQTVGAVKALMEGKRSLEAKLPSGGTELREDLVPVTGEVN